MGITPSRQHPDFDGESSDHDLTAESSAGIKSPKFLLTINELETLYINYDELRECPDDVDMFSFEGQVLPAKCVKVYDGDTAHFAMRFNNKWVRFRCRMMGYNSPEVRGPERLNGGIAARDYLASMIDLKRVILKLHEFDKYGRPLADVYVPENPELPPRNSNDYIYVNECMVNSGHGIPYIAK